MRIDRRFLGWGAVLVIAGAIPLAVRAGALQRAAVADWPALWPLLLIGGGLGLILRRTPVHLIGSFVTVVTAGVMAGGLLATGFGGITSFGACGIGSAGTAFTDRNGNLTDRGTVSIEFNCGTLRVAAIDGSSWTLSGRGPSDRQPLVTEDPAGVRIVPAKDSTFNFGDVGSSWDVEVPRAPTTNLSVTLNAGEGTLDLAGTSLDATNLTVNAGSLKVDLGAAESARDVSATVNAGDVRITLPASVAVANLTLNAGAMKVCVPSDAKLRISWSGGLAGHNLDALGLTKLGENEWATSGVTFATTASDLNVSANAGSFNLVIGGSCNA